MTTPSGSLEGRTVLVTGATGQVGWGVARAAAAAGADLVLPTRTNEGASAIRADFPAAHVVIGDLAGMSGSGEPAAMLDGVDRLDHVVAPIGSWWQRGRTIDQPVDELDDLLSTYVSAQLGLLRATAPLLRAVGGSYTLVSGAAGEIIIPNSGLLVVAVRAQYALADVLRHELADDTLRFNELRIMARIERDLRPGVIISEDAGQRFVELMAGDARSALVRYPD